MEARQLILGQRSLDLASPRVMGILNVTPDSFSDGGLHLHPAAAVARALEMVAEGADIIDVGGESTRPGAEPVSVHEEIDRVAGTIGALRPQTDVIISVDTSKPEVMQAAVAAGADLLNDVRALRVPGALEMAQRLDVPVCLMHMQGEPGTMQRQPCYKDAVAEILTFLLARIRACEDAGINKDKLLIDPGFGFGKLLQHNLALLRSLKRFAQLECPLLVGLSRKSMIPQMLESVRVPCGEANSADRLVGSVTLALYAVRHGANIVRVHDVKQTVAALTVQRIVAGGTS